MERAVLTRPVLFQSTHSHLGILPIVKPAGTFILLDRYVNMDVTYLRKAMLPNDRTRFCFVTQADFKPLPEFKSSFNQFALRDEYLTRYQPGTIIHNTDKGDLVALRNEPMNLKRWLILIISSGIAFGIGYYCYQWWSLLTTAVFAWGCYEVVTAPEVVFIRNDSKGRTYHV